VRVQLLVLVALALSLLQLLELGEGLDEGFTGANQGLRGQGN
jgi:hypothetical protein